MPRLWAKTVSFESVNVGDTLPILVKWEDRDTVGQFAGLLAPVAATGEEASPEDEATGTSPTEVDDSTVTLQALLAYVTELLEKAFPVDRVLARGSRIELESLAPAALDRTISLSGKVVGKREEGEHRLVECLVAIDNQEGQAIARAVAAVSF